MDVTVRMLAVDPRMGNDARIHTLGWSDPEQLVSEFARGLNYAFGDDDLRFRADPVGAFYTPNVPYRPVVNVYTPYTEGSDPYVYLSGDEFAARHSAPTPTWPYDNHPNVGGLSCIKDATWAGFDLVADRNAGAFDILIYCAPGALPEEGRYNGLAECYGVWATGDDRSHPLNGGTYFLDGLRRDKPFILVYANMTRGVAELTHSFSHATGDAGIMSHMFSGPGSHTQFDHDIRHVMTPFDLFMTYDTIEHERGIAGEAHCGTCHFLPNSASDYDYANSATVVSNAHMWLSYPDGPGWDHGRLKLANPDRRGTFGPVDLLAPDMASFDPAQRPYLWQWKHWPRRGDVTIDGRSCDWRKYLNLNYQEGWDMPTTPPTTGAAVPTVNVLPEQSAWVIMVGFTPVDYALDEASALAKVSAIRLSQPGSSVAVWLDVKRIRFAELV